MKKTDKKIDNQLRQALTYVCEIALKEINGFEWLTHTASYSEFPRTLKIICIFDSNDSLAEFEASGGEKDLISLIKQRLAKINIHLKDISKHVVFDTEENCDREHNGNWALRLG